MRIEPLKLAPITSQAAIELQRPGQAGEKSFGQFLSEALQDVNTLQHQADTASINLAAGKLEDVSQAVIAAEKATIALQLTLQVRNKVVEAYQEVMRMQV